MKKPEAYIRAIADLKAAKDQVTRDNVTDYMQEILVSCNRTEMQEILNRITEKV